MNASTLLHLRKEARALLPMWAVTMTWMVAPLFLANDPIPYSFAGFLFGCAVLGPVCVGNEFHHQTMGMLLSQPVARRQLWREKLAVVGVALLILSALLVIEVLATHGGQAMVSDILRKRNSTELMIFFGIPIALSLMGLCTGPALTLITRHALGGAALTFLIPWLLIIGGLLLIEIWGGGVESDKESLFYSYLVLTGSLYTGCSYLFGCWKFERPEDTNRTPDDLAVPKLLAARLGWLARCLCPRPTGVVMNLLRKELWLQRPTFIVVASVVALWMALGIVRLVVPSMDEKLLWMPSVMLVLAVPWVAGVISTAEERNWGVQECQLTQPISAPRKWFVKVFATLITSAVLGLLVPLALAELTNCLSMHSVPVESRLESYRFCLIWHVVLLAAAMYASTFSPNSVLAIVGTMALFLAGAMVLNFTDHVVTAWPNADPRRHVDTLDRGWIGMIHANRWTLGWAALAVWLYFLGLGNFRRSLQSLWRPVGEMALFFVVMCGFILVAIGW